MIGMRMIDSQNHQTLANGPVLGLAIARGFNQIMMLLIVRMLIGRRQNLQNLRNTVVPRPAQKPARLIRIIPPRLRVDFLQHHSWNVQL